MPRSFEPTPTVATMNVMHNGDRDAHHFSYASLVVLAFEGKDFARLFFGRLGVPIFLATIVSSVDEFIGKIPRSCFPRKMMRIHAAEMAVSAGVCRLMLARWWLPMNALADDAVDGMASSVEPDPTVSVARFAIRPEDAGIFIFEP